MKAWLSTMPVEGESRALVQARFGSSARASAARETRMLGDAVRRRARLDRGQHPVLVSEVATISLPQLLNGTPFSLQ